MSNPITILYNHSIYRNYTNYQNKSIIPNNDTISNEITYIRSSLTTSAIRNNKYNIYNNLFDVGFPVTSVDPILINQAISLARRGYFIFFEYASKKNMFYKLQSNIMVFNILYFFSNGDNEWFNIDNWYLDQQLQNKAKRLPTVNDHIIVRDATITNTTDNNINIQSIELYNSIVSTNLTANFLILNSSTIQASTINGSVSLYGTSSINSESVINGPGSINNNSSNNGLINGNVIFYNNSINNGFINGNVEFTDNSINNSPLVNISGIIYCNTNGNCESKGISNSLILNEENSTITILVGQIQTIGSIINTDQKYIFTKAGIGTLVINGPSQHSNNTIINQGKIIIEHPEALGTSNITINSGATLDLNGLSISNVIINNGGNIVNAPKNESVPVLNNGGSISEYTPSNECGTANIAGSYFNNLWSSCATWGPNGIPLWTSVGTNGGSSFYGTYDQVGNVAEITDTTYGIFRIIRGSDYRVPLPSIETRFDLQFGGDGQPENIVGFRIVCLNDSVQYSSLMNNYNDFITIGHPNNPKDESAITDVTGRVGSVPYIYKITKYSITNYEYIKFLNSVDPDGINTDNIYHEWMNPENDIVYGAIEFDNNAPKGQKYSAKPSMNNKPVVYITWYEAARFCNWLHNGAKQYSASYGNNTPHAPHNYGAYDLSDVNNLTMYNKKPLISAKYRLQTSDEWHKAAYYEESSTFKGYHKYPTRSEKIVCVTSTPDGSGIIPTSCDPPNPVIDQCGQITDIEQSNNLYYFSGGPNQWNDLNYWWTDDSQTVHPSSLPTKDDNVYVLPGSIVNEQQIIYVGNIIFDGSYLQSTLFAPGLIHFKNSSSISIDGTLIGETVIFLNGSNNNGDISANTIYFFGSPIPKAYFPSPRTAFYHFCNDNLKNANHILPTDIEKFPSYNAGNIIGNVIFSDTCINSGIITGYNSYPCVIPITCDCDPLREITEKLEVLYKKFRLLYIEINDNLIYKKQPLRIYSAKFYGYSINDGKLINPIEAEFRPSSYGFHSNSGDILRGRNIKFITCINSGFICHCKTVIFDQSINHEDGTVLCARNTVLRSSINFGAIVGSPLCATNVVLTASSSSRGNFATIGTINCLTMERSSFSTGTLIDIGKIFVNFYSSIYGGSISHCEIIGYESPTLYSLTLFENPSWFYIPELNGTFWLNQIYYGNEQPLASGTLDIFSTKITCGPCTPLYPTHACNFRICYNIADCGSDPDTILDHRPTSPTFGQCIPATGIFPA